jgi:hypothetical protein
MSFDLQKTLADKRALRQRLASRPIEEKLRMLDALRERELAIRGGEKDPGAAPAMLREEQPPYRPRSK